MPNVEVVEITNFEGGINTLQAQTAIEETEALVMKNLLPGFDGEPLAPRPGIALFQDEEIEEGFSVKGLHRYEKADGSDFWLASCGTKLYASDTTAIEDTEETLENTEDFWTLSEVDNGSDFESWPPDNWSNDGASVFAEDTVVFKNGLASAKLSGTSEAFQSCSKAYVGFSDVEHSVYFRINNKMADEHGFIYSSDSAASDIINAGGEFRLRTGTLNGTTYEFSYMEYYDYSLAAVIRSSYFDLEVDTWYRFYYKLNDDSSEGTIKVYDTDDTTELSSLTGSVSSVPAHIRIATKSSDASSCSINIDDYTDTVAEWSDWLSPGVSSYPYARKGYATWDSEATSSDIVTTVSGQRVEFWGYGGYDGILEIEMYDGSWNAITDGDAMAGAGVDFNNVDAGLSLAYTMTLGAAGTYKVRATVNDNSIYLGKIVISDSISSFSSIYTWNTSDQEVFFAVFGDDIYICNGEETVEWTGAGAATLISTGGGNDCPDDVIYLMEFRKRLWAVTSASPSTLYFSASNDVTEWNDSAGDSGSFQVEAEDGHAITGLAVLSDGVIVFKEKNVYILEPWDDSFRPDDAESGYGTTIRRLVSGVGCASAYTLASYNDNIIFLGQNSHGDFAVYVLNTEGVEEISIKIPEQLKRISRSFAKLPIALVHDHYYICAVDDKGDTATTDRTLCLVVDMRRGCWATFEGWNVGSFSADAGYLFIGDGTDGYVYSWGNNGTDNGVAIDWEYESPLFDWEEPFSRKRIRNAWAAFGGSVQESVTFSIKVDKRGLHSKSFDLTGVTMDYWDDGTLWARVPTFDDVWPYDSEENEQYVSLAFPRHGYRASINLQGSTSYAEDWSIQKVGLAARAKKARYVNP